MRAVAEMGRTLGAIDVLLVDDDDAVRTSFGDVLRDAGYATLEATDCLSALEHLESSTVRSVLLDVRMPGLDGLWLLDQLEDPPPIILITGHDYDAQARARADKVFKYLQKPVSPVSLLEIVALAVACSGS